MFMDAGAYTYLYLPVCSSANCDVKWKFNKLGRRYILVLISIASGRRLRAKSLVMAAVIESSALRGNTCLHEACVCEDWIQIQRIMYLVQVLTSLCVVTTLKMARGYQSCSRPRAPSHGFISRCTDGIKHLSVCKTICEPGYEMRGDSQMLCWCGQGQCSWRGVKPSCEVARCETPDFDEGRIRVVDRWPTGFAGIMEMENVPDIETKLTTGWSLVLILDRALGKYAALTSWNAEVVSASYDRQTFTLANRDHNSDLSKYLDSPDIRWSFVFENLEGEPPEEAYLGLYNQQVSDASCLKAPKMVRIKDAFPRGEHIPPTTLPTTTEEPFSPDTSTASSTTTSTVPTTTTTTTLSTAATTTTATTTTTTTSEPTTTTKKPKKKARKRRRRKHKNKDKTTTTVTPEVTTVAESFSDVSDEPLDTDSEENANTTIEKSGGRYCKLQTHSRSYKTQDGWEDKGVPFFSGNAILNVTDHLLDWAMLMVFDSPIQEMQVWSVTLVDKSPDGIMWTFGPHEWNIDLYVGESDINFIAKQAAKTPHTPVAKIYLCSLAFAEGDTIVVTRGSPAQIALANGNFGFDETENQPDDAGDSTTQAEQKEEELVDIGTVERWVKPETVEKRCLPESPNGIVPSPQPQTAPDFKPNDDGTKYNYNEVLHKSLLFYEAQRAGKLPKSNRIPWRGDSTLKDGCDIGVDLSGGWFDAGDHVKFALPMANSVAMLAWGGLMFGDAYKDADEFKTLLDCIKWPVQYLMKSHISKYEFVAQVGSGEIDHRTYGRPEEMRMKRPTFVLTPEKPGSEPTAEAAAALSAAHLLFKGNKKMKLITRNTLKHAIELFEFADRFREAYHNSIEDVKDFYFSFSGYKDELVWGAAWLYKATGDTKYLLKAKTIYIELGGQYAVESEYSWDRKLIGAQILLANLTGEELYRKPISSFLENVVNAKNTTHGLMWLRKWGANRYAANAAFMVMAASTLTPPLPQIDKYVAWARKQIHLLLGDIGRSYVVGFGRNYPQRIHHRSSACTPYPDPCNRKTFYTPRPSYFVLYGGLVGGPDENEFYSENRINYEQTEVACDYNAGFQGATAGLKHIAMQNRPPPFTGVNHDLRRWSG